MLNSFRTQIRAVADKGFTVLTILLCGGIIAVGASVGSDDSARATPSPAANFSSVSMSSNGGALSAPNSINAEGSGGALSAQD